MKYVQVVVAGERVDELVARMKELGFQKVREPKTPSINDIGWCRQGLMLVVTAEGEVDQIELLFQEMTEMNLWDEKVGFRKIRSRVWHGFRIGFLCFEI